MLQSPIVGRRDPELEPQHARLVERALDLDLLDRLDERLGAGASATSSV